MDKIKYLLWGAVGFGWFFVVMIFTYFVFTKMRF